MKHRILLTVFFVFTLFFIGLVNISAQEAESVGVKDGGISVKGWTGMIDAKEAKALHITTGPAVTYWNPDNKAKGDYTVSATFSEPKYMSINDHPHPYGIMIAGNDLGTDSASYLYCAAYGNGTFIVRGFGPQPFQMNGPRA